ncbi:MAG: dienelactone hydrolase family protein [Alphaproteobacteria bacterium]|nr:dienelactone hydrolase family protein [Alphaproteobacteria bacterium]MBV9692886.1 dienelactone hydrolase family protein [Alphaproteobacteria bacterium]
MIERRVDIATKNGAMATFIVHPERGGPHPVILFFMDAPGIREELRDMARRLATSGYYVMLPNLYYRSGAEELGVFIGEQASATRKKMFALMSTLSIPLVMADGDALLAHASGDPAASKGPVGTLGYCMSGQYAIAAAGRHPERVRAAASIYGVRLKTDAVDSPHLAAAKSKAEIYVAWAETDHYAPLEELPPLEAALRESGVKHEVELYKGADHGFAFPERPAYDKQAAERHWERLLALYGRALRS